MENKRQITVPDCWHEVTIEQFQKISAITTEGEARTIDVISILIKEHKDNIMYFDIKTLTSLVKLLTWTSSLPDDADYSPVLTIDGEEYGIISRLNDLSIGEWIDLESYITQDPIQNIHFIMSILYRPLITAFNDRDRLIEDYDTSVMLRQAELFKDKVMISDVYGALVFFYLIANEYMKVTATCLTEVQ